MGEIVLTDEEIKEYIDKFKEAVIDVNEDYIDTMVNVLRWEIERGNIQRDLWDIRDRTNKMKGEIKEKVEEEFEKLLGSMR